MMQVEGQYLEYIGSYSGQARLKLCLARRTRKGQPKRVWFEVTIQRGDLHCIVTALKDFANAEREAIERLPL